MGEELLAPQDVYLKSGIHIGTKFRTKYMAPFIYKIRPDGLSIMNVEEIDRRLKIASNFLAQYNPEDIIVACRRENGWKAVSLFGKATGIRTFIGRYPPGTLTNPNLKTYTEAKLIFVVDPWPDKNIVDDAARVGIPVIALCDTNNQSNNVDFVIPCNNKGKKSLGLIFWVLAREYLKKKGIIRNEEEFKYILDEFSEE
jgi:small subunit ribosomal protein S2